MCLIFDEHIHMWISLMNWFLMSTQSKQITKQNKNYLNILTFNVFPQGWCYYYLFSRKNWDKVLYCLLEYGTGRIQTHSDRFEGPHLKSQRCYSTKPGWNGVAEERAMLIARTSLKVEFLLSSGYYFCWFFYLRIIFEHPGLKILASKSDILDFIPRIHIPEGENWLLETSL